MPLTFPAHQVAVLPLKLWRPRWFDGTALVIGAGSPDLFSGLTKIVGFDSHHWDGVMWAVPFTIIYATLLRRFAADGLFGSMPDMWLLKTRSYRVLRHGRPRLLVTVLSAFIGVMSHITLDSFTHPYRWGSNLLRLNDIALQTPLGGVTQAGVLQYIGHSFGSLVGVVLFVIVVSRRHLGEWYGEDVVEAARHAPVRPGASRRTALILVASITVGIIWGFGQGGGVIFTTGICFVLGLLAAGASNHNNLSTLPVDIHTSTLPVDIPDHARVRSPQANSPQAPVDIRTTES